MASAAHELMLQLLQACAEREPEPLYPALYVKEQQLDRDKVDAALDELRRRGLIQLTDWVRERGQGRALTEAGKKALETKNLAPAVSEVPVNQGRGDGSLYERGEIVRNAIFDPEQPWVCWVLIVLNVAAFLFGAVYAWQNNYVPADYLMGNDGVARSVWNVVRDLGGLRLYEVVFEERPQYERLILSAFLHLGILHLAMNMFSLGSVGGLVESMWGKARFLALYFISAFVSGCVILSIELVQESYHLSAGASGAVYGVVASMFVWFTLNRRHLPEHFLQDHARVLSLNVFLMISMNMLPGVSWQGHLGGAIGGALTAVLLQVQRFHPNRAMRILALLALPLIPAFFFLLLLWQVDQI